MSVSHYGRNAPCLCGSGKKYKRCCLGKIDWDALQNQPIAIQTRFQTVRGKNLTFLALLTAILELDPDKRPFDFKAFKTAFTPKAVRAIYETIPQIWPDYDDYARALLQERETVSALYTGTYTPDAVIKAVTRHSLYSTRILLVDPFLHPYRPRPQFNPLIHPEEHRGNAVKFAFLWLSLAPWISAGIVGFVRMPGDFDSSLFLEDAQTADARLSKHPELKQALEEQVEQQLNLQSALDRGWEEYYMLSHSNEALLQIFGDMIHDANSPFSNAEQLIAFFERRRDEHPYFVRMLPGQNSELTMHTSGASYEMGKRICALGDFHMITDFRSRWLELKLDFESVRGNLRNWSPFANAFEGTTLKVLDNVPLDAALKLRNENRLESMRLFLRKVWSDTREAENFAEENAIALASELDDKIREAEVEYKKIDQELLQWAGAGLSTFLATGTVGFVPAASAAVLTSALGLSRSQSQRRSFETRFSAGFFLGMKRR
jgi:hypothetical protein